MFFLFLWGEATPVEELENYLSQKRSTVYRIRETTPKGDTIEGKLYWDKSGAYLKFAFLLGAPLYRKVLIINDKKKVVLHQEALGQKDKIKPKDITNSPLATIFLEKVKFVQHKDSPVRTTMEVLGENFFRLKIHHFSDLKCQKEHLILEYKVNKKQVTLLAWKTIVFGKNNKLRQTEIAFLDNSPMKKSPDFMNPNKVLDISDFH